MSIIKAYGLFDTNGEGYPTKLIKVYPIEAAARQARGSYQDTWAVDLLAVKDEYYVLREPQAIDSKLICSELIEGSVVRMYKVTAGSHIKFVLPREFHKYIEWGPSATVQAYIILRYDNKYYAIHHACYVPIKLEPYLPSREIAVKAALDKLTEEEKKLLGLI